MATRYRPIPEVQKTERSPGVNANRGKQVSTKNTTIRGNRATTIVPGNNYSNNYSITLNLII